MEDISKETQSLIARDFEIEIGEESMTDEQLFDLLADHIAYMIEYRIDFLLSLMYRLDVSERKINQALSPAAPDPANIGLAKLVIERQKQRIFTKKHYKQADLKDWDDF
ncbi:MAG TPA: hypothetical protein ENK52_03545 [Saprospiraceae bacterium]|nr:hypothetical protein [Saprospiraceae bacterium]